MKSISEIDAVALVEQFISENYDLRYNVLLGHVEMSDKPMTERDEKSLILAARAKFPEMTNVKAIVTEYLGSNSVREYNPIEEFLSTLPKWDGHDHVGELLDRIPGIEAMQKEWARTWFRGTVSQWSGDNMLYGNQCVLTLIGAQGCRKSTFLQQLLPESLRYYYLDNINLVNKFSRDMALTHNLIVNIDEMDQIKEAQQAELKFCISRPVVNGRPIYGRTQVKRKRYASFVATTNSPHPLNDPTGSRRFLCMKIADGKKIDVETAIDYGQLYAQIVHEIKDEHLRSWFTDEEVIEIQKFNAKFQSTTDLGTMLSICFRKPTEEETGEKSSLKEIADVVTSQFPNSTKIKTLDIRLGILLCQQGYAKTHTRSGNVYYVMKNKA